MALGEPSPVIISALPFPSFSLELQMKRIVSYFGGKDSTALCLWMLERGKDFSPVCADTGANTTRHKALSVLVTGSLATRKRSKVIGSGGL